MRVLILLLLLFQAFFQIPVKAVNIKITNLTCEYQESPLSVETVCPRFSWKLESDGRNMYQTARHIIIAESPSDLKSGKNPVWDSGMVNSDDSQLVEYGGAELKPGKTYYWKVRVQVSDNKISDWSKIGQFTIGLLSESCWNNAKWIGLEEIKPKQRIVPGIHGGGPANLDKGLNKLPVFRKEFKIEKPVKRALAYVSGLGQFEMRLNGKKTGDHFMDPAWTAYDSYAQYVTFDITDCIKRGDNAVGIMLGNGFYHIPRDRYRKLIQTFGYPKMICRIVIEYTNGTIKEIKSDTSWKVKEGPVTFSSIYGGEDYDARMYDKGWDAPWFDDSEWPNAIEVSPVALRPQTTTPLKIMESFKPVSVTPLTNSSLGNIFIYDLGQNASGIPYIKVKGKKGDKIRLIPGELIDDNGFVTQQASGGPVYFDYTLSGDGVEEWHPVFTYYGFRYVQVEGGVPSGNDNPDGRPVILNLEGFHTRNSATSVGKFECSNELFNKIFRLIDWSVRSNMASVFTDCPHREKLGWLEVAHLMGYAVRYNYDISRYYSKIIEDIKATQLPNGMVPDIAPEYPIFDGGFRDSPEWGSAGIILPWYMYKWYGDRKILETSYNIMVRYAGYLESVSNNHIITNGLGDWYDLGPNFPGESQLTPRGLTPTAIYYYDINILAQTAKLLGYEADVKKWEELSLKIKHAFNGKFFNTGTKQYGTGSQTANAMALYMGLVEPENRSVVISNLKADFENRNNSITAGDIGFRYVLRVLEKEGASDLIFAMNNRSDVPGYGFQLAKGATSLTESWAALRYVSNNHCMLGHLMEWFYSGAAGIRPDEKSVGFRDIIIHPEPVGDLTYVSSQHDSPYGKISSYWEKKVNEFSLRTEIPVNTHAVIYIPVEDGRTLTESGVPVAERTDMKILGRENGRIVISTGSGLYNFNVK